MSVTVRAVARDDRAGWDRLYQAYAEFYGVAQDDAMRDRVWGWLMDADHSTFGLVAETDGALVGLAHLRPFARPLAASEGVFLDDLFVAPAARGSGVVDALMAAMAQIARDRGWGKVRWITADDNARARKVYDKYATATHWVTYDMDVAGDG